MIALGATEVHWSKRPEDADYVILASQLIPQQWRAFRLGQPPLGGSAEFYGASPCTNDRQIHYRVLHKGPESVAGGERLTHRSGRVCGRACRRHRFASGYLDLLLSDWLATSGRREKHAPEFERFTRFLEDGTPIGPVEIWNPLEPLATD